MNQKRLDVTVVVPVKNEEQNLGRCLSLLNGFAEIVVVDSSSSDRTPQIASEYNARYLNFAWNGKYPKKRNWFLLNHTISTSWVLFLDADEFVTPQFYTETERAIENSKIDAYWLNYTNWFLGRKLRHGVPQRKLALFRRGRGLYEKIDEDYWSALDMEIHEHPIIDGAIGEIRARIDHNDDRGILKFIDRHRGYAAWEANRVGLLQRNPEAWSLLTKRQTFKYTHISKPWYPVFYFLYQYIVKGGILDGSAGLQFAFYKLWYFNTIRLLVAASSNGKVG